MSSTTAIDAEIFIKFLRRLRQVFRRQPIALFMDQLKVHKARAVQPVYQELNILPIYNIGYSPQFNPIEAVFSKIKRAFCSERLRCLVNKIGFNAERTIKSALVSITQEHCAACARKSRHILERAS